MHDNVITVQIISHAEKSEGVFTLLSFLTLEMEDQINIMMMNMMILFSNVMQLLTWRNIVVGLHISTNVYKQKKLDTWNHTHAFSRKKEGFSLFFYFYFQDFLVILKLLLENCKEIWKINSHWIDILSTPSDKPLFPKLKYAYSDKSEILQSIYWFSN